jgi:murein endopeptidase
MRTRSLLLTASLLVACAGPIEPDSDGATDALDVAIIDDSAPADVAAMLDATESSVAQDAAVEDRRDSAVADAGIADTGVADSGAGPSGVAPMGAVSSEIAARDGRNPVPGVAGGEVVFRVDARPSEHVQFFLRFTAPAGSVVMQVDRWNGSRPVELGRTDAGPGLRVLAVFDPSGPRTFWARVRSTTALAGATLEVLRTPFADGTSCSSDCARLMQLPLPNDRSRDGYAMDSTVVYRYQFGRRDLLMFIRAAGQEMGRRGHAPVLIEDLSQWDGLTPGTDTGSLRHASHQRGKDVDISLYGVDRQTIWRSFCTIQRSSSGRECVAGTARDFDGALNALYFSRYFATNRVTVSFLDRELIALVVPAARMAVFAPSVLAQFTDGVHVQHWPNHDNHIHIRVSESAGGSAIEWDSYAPP